MGHFVEALGREGWGGPVVAPRVHDADPSLDEFAGCPLHRFESPGEGRRLKELGNPSPWLVGRYVWSGLRQVLATIREQRPRVIYAHWLLPTGFIGALASRWTGVPLVVHVHGSDVHRYAVSSNLSRRIARWTLSRCAGLVSVSRDLLGRIEKDLGHSARKARVIPMGLPANRFTPRGREEARGSLGLDGEWLEVLFVGDVEIGKGILDLVQALRKRSDLPGRLRLHVIGDGADREEIERGAGEASSLRIVCHGRRDAEEVALWMRAADLLVLPSQDNAQRVMEALIRFGFGAAGIPRELFEREGGVVHLGSEPNRIDLLTHLRGVSTDKVFSNKVRAELETIPVDVIALPDLIAAKRASSRTRDLADAVELEKLLGAQSP